MNKSLSIPSKTQRILIIGNADDSLDISDKVTTSDFVIRFNKANASCKVKADYWFIANGAITVIRKLHIFNDSISPEAKIIWRYSLKDILNCSFEKISLSRRLRYLIYISKFKKINHMSRYTQVNFPKCLLKECTEVLQGKMPSSGFLMIYTMRKLYPNIPLYIHNFTFKGTVAHDWEIEEKIIKRLIDQKLIFTTDQFT